MTTTFLYPLIPVILSGGAGTRLWPVSRESHPKPFIKLPDNQSLLEKTYCRAVALPGVVEVITVTNRDYYFRCRDEYHTAVEHSAVTARYLLEPFGRNTAPAITLAALEIEKHYGRNAVLLVFPSDHLIPDVSAFTTVTQKAIELAKQGMLVTFGVTPTAPETGFGYIEQGEAIESLGYQVARFVEKPDCATAESYLASGRYTWNAGIFCFTVGTLLDAMQAYAPEVLRVAQTVLGQSLESNTSDHIEFLAESFKQLPDISIDYAIMEHAQNIAVVSADFEWNDIGSWNALASLIPEDEQGNRISGEVIALETQNSYLRSESRMMGVIGLENLVVIDTPDALLVAHRDKLQLVKEIVTHLKAIGHSVAHQHRTAYRPWGCYTVLEEGTRFKIKRIEVKPKASLSLQMHYHRSEHWIVVSGTAKVTHNGQELLLRTDESTYIPAGHQHRLENPGVIPLVMIEVQSGGYLGEDDIVRFGDMHRGTN